MRCMAEGCGVEKKEGQVCEVGVAGNSVCSERDDCVSPPLPPLKPLRRSLDVSGFGQLQMANDQKGGP